MRIIEDTDGASVAASLDDAWGAPETFALVPRAHRAALSWLERALDDLPAPLRRDHFGLLTSGSTGTPKVVLGSRKRAEALTRVLHAVQASEPVETSIGLLPLGYAYAFVNQWLWAQVHQRRFVTTPGLREPDAVLGTLALARSAMLCLVPSQAALLLYHCRGRTFPGVIRVHFAGGRFPGESLGELRGVFPEAEVYNNYGCTEAMPRLCVRRVGDEAEPGNVGEPIPGVELALSSTSELVFRSRYGAVAEIEAGHLRSFEEEEWLPTGDIASRGPGGDWDIAGRASEIFKRHGEKVSVPAVLAVVEQVYRGAVGHYRDKDRRGEDGYVLVLAPSPPEAEVMAILTALRRAHPRSQWPLRIESVERLPSLPNGKLDTSSLATAALRQTLWDQRV